MARKTIDWEALRQDYMRHNYENLKVFAEAHSLNWGTVRNRCSGWANEKITYRERVSDLALHYTQEADAMTLSERNIFHVNMWDRFMGIVSDAFDSDTTIRNADGSIKVGTVERLANIIDKAQRGQRLALNMDRETKDAKGLLSEISAAINAAKSAYVEDDTDETQPETT